MFLLEFDTDDVKKEASKLLKKLGVKHRLKKFEVKGTDNKETNGVFKVHLEKQPKKKAKIQQFDQSINIPAFLVDACSYLRAKLDSDGIFRKPGVSGRQKEMKELLAKGGQLFPSCEHNVNDVADLLKQFFRELPEPCIPYIFHDIFQKCLESKALTKDTILVTVLLLPLDHLFTLAFLMEFLQEVANYHERNRMDICNLAIVWTPNLMPFKTGQVNDKQVIQKRLSIIQVLIENSSQIGVVPECLYGHLSSWTPHCSLSSHDELQISRQEKKRKRSGSLTRMLSGIRNMVRRSSSQERLSTPDQPVAHTPRIVTTSKKRKASEANQLSQSAKKRRDLLESLPQKSLLPDVCATYLTPRVLIAQPHLKSCHIEENEPKRTSRFYTYRTPVREKERKSYRSLSGTKLRLSNFGIGKKQKKRPVVMETSSNELTETPNNFDLTTNSEDYVRISRSEYEDIKNRVSKIEHRISSEFENIIGVSMSDLEMTPDKPARNSLKAVQSVYEKTLESAGKLNGSASDELARRLSKELKIRDSLENKVMRSPSARKIGSLRRRSKENIPFIKRNLSLNIPDRWNARHQFYPLSSLRRGKPNTLHNGLPEPFSTTTDKPEQFKDFANQLNSESFDCQTFEPSEFDLNSFGVLTRSQARRASSFHGCEFIKDPKYLISPPKCTNNNTPNNETGWKSADVFLKEEKSEDIAVTGRPSVAKIRSQNAGMVLAKAKLFNTMLDTEDKGEVIRPFKTQKSIYGKSRELKKRNSSKSSKERKQKNVENKCNFVSHSREQLVDTQFANSITNLQKKSDSCLVSKVGNSSASCEKENYLKSKSQTFPSSSAKTTLADGKIKSSCTLSKQSKLMSPLRVNHNKNKNSGTQQTSHKIAMQGRSPNIARHILSRSASSPIKTSTNTPRRSPRSLILKSRLNKKN